MEALITLLLGLLDRAAAISALLTKTRAEGREPSAEELASLDADFDFALQVLSDAIATAKAEGR